jgi:hypothetical protein
MMWEIRKLKNEVGQVKKEAKKKKGLKGKEEQQRGNKGEKKLKESSLSKGPYHCNSQLGFCCHTLLFSTSGDYCSLSLHKDTWVLVCEIIILVIRCAMLWVLVCNGGVLYYGFSMQ